MSFFSAWSRFSSSANGVASASNLVRSAPWRLECSASCDSSRSFRPRCWCSRPLSSHSPARPCASAASPCAFFATSPLRWVRSSRVSSPVVGASKRAAAAPSAAPKRNQPMYAPPSPLWSLMVISLFLSEALNEHPQALLEPHRHADQLPGARQAAQHPHEPREPIGHALDLVGHRADALELAARLADEPADVLGQRVGLAHKGPELLCDDRQHALGALSDPPEGEGGRHGRHERQHQRDGGEDQERLGPEGHGVLNYWWKTERKSMKLEA